MADAQIYSGSKVSVPKSYVVPGSAEFILKAVNADFDGSGAGGTYTPCVTLLSDSGHVIARAVDNTITVAAGSDAEVSWFPLRRRRGAAAQGLSCKLLGKGNGTTTLAITLDTSVPSRGTLQVVCGQVSVPDGVDGGSEISGVVDSGGLGPWRRPFAPNSAPLIGNVRQTALGNAFSVQASSACRACVAGDLGVGATVTVSFSSVAPANFHSAGLVIYQPTAFFAVKQFGSIAYGNNDAHPNVDPSLTSMSWDTDYGPGFSQADEDAIMITAMGAYPAVAGFQPLNGTVIGEIATGSVSIAAACAQVCALTFPDPGGTWPAGAQGIVGNYQYAQPRICTN